MIEHEDAAFTLQLMTSIRKEAGRRLNSITVQRLLGAEEAMKHAIGQNSLIPAWIQSSARKIQREHRTERPQGCPCPVCKLVL